MSHLLFITVLLASVAGKPVSPPARPRAIVLPAAAPQIVTMTATPGTINFSAANPDSPLVAGSAPASIHWFQNGQSRRTWTLSVQSSTATFTNCPRVPVSAVTVTCSGISVNGTSQPCGPAVNLSTTPQVVANGLEGAGLAYFNVTLTFTLTDSWTYSAELNPKCALSLTYNGNFN
jgi:hypothetical protein